ncbi:hypothetical protein NTH_04367 (plasmid) [Nitratireductor thuwali]|uniref:Uncharacterized protein n=1 Tax=Nitratireductor thuwali TaxID=2267699 RepID=A0ABY5MPX3_9HYPH|nr:hypothetical protein NTH_04367 [Nitratireductor thuwali]
MQTLEQGQAQHLLKVLDLLADRPRRNREFLRASFKLRWRPAASKARKPLSGGSR